MRRWKVKVELKFTFILVKESICVCLPSFRKNKIDLFFKKKKKKAKMFFVAKDLCLDKNQPGLINFNYFRFQESMFQFDSEQMEISDMCLRLY